MSRFPSSDILAIPKGRIGRFIAERKIGQGSLGTVYLFRDPLIGRKVAIKVLNARLDQRKSFEENFIHEARAAGRLNHPNIVTIYDVDKDGELLFIAMEYLDGQPLRDMLAGDNQFNYKQIAYLIARVANALDYAHQNGVIHRDIKPSNIFIIGGTTPKILDFGIASATDNLSEDDVDATTILYAPPAEESALMGTPTYMSPEQARGEALDARTDIFSLGVVLYELLCGSPPFKAENINALLEAVARDAPIPPQDVCAGVPLRLARIAAKAMAKNPEDRYARAADMANDLNRFLVQERTNRIIAQMQQPQEDEEEDQQQSIVGSRVSAFFFKHRRALLAVAGLSLIAAAVAARYLYVK